MAELSTMARPYAKAAFEYALSSEKLDNWSRMLKTAAGVAEQPKVAELLTSPSATSEQLSRIFIDLCGDELSKHGANFVSELATNKRLSLLPQISDQFEELKAQQQQIVDVVVTSAFPLDEAQQKALGDKLSQKLHQDVQMHTEVDKSLLGGVFIRAGDLVIDGSVRGKLAKLAEVMNQ
jgi:F-type H+-transporting ATPase subunit delta